MTDNYPHKWKMPKKPWPYDEEEDEDDWPDDPYDKTAAKLGKIAEDIKKMQQAMHAAEAKRCNHQKLLNQMLENVARAGAQKIASSKPDSVPPELPKGTTPNEGRLLGEKRVARCTPAPTKNKARGKK